MRVKLVQVISHITGWVFFFSLIFIFLSNTPSGQTSFAQRLFSAPFLIFGLTYIVLFYLNNYLLVPRLYLQKKYLWYAGSLIALFFIVYSISPFDGLMRQRLGMQQNFMPAMPRLMDPGHQPPPPKSGNERFPPPGGNRPPMGQPRKNTDINSIIIFITVIAISTAMPVIKQWRLTEKRALLAEAQKATAELYMLKSQVNPHFLFNTLNNIYSLAVTNSPHTASSIMKLSKMMRYLTDEVGEDFVSLDDELECMHDFIDLQKLRISNTDVDFTVEGNTTAQQIAPLILMTFVENAFKYGISSHSHSFIRIVLRVTAGTIQFSCSNKIHPNKTKTIPGREGTGIANVKQRLQLLYADKHQLVIDTADERFTVQLTIQLH